MKKKVEEAIIEEVSEERIVENGEASEELPVINETPEPNSEIDCEKARVWVYIGPTVRGVITNGSIFFGTKKNILGKLPDDWRKMPKIERLIVPDKNVSHAKAQIFENKGGISAAYNTVAAAIQHAAKEA